MRHHHLGLGSALLMQAATIATRIPTAHHDLADGLRSPEVLLVASNNDIDVDKLPDKNLPDSIDGKGDVIKAAVPTDDDMLPDIDLDANIDASPAAVIAMMHGNTTSTRAAIAA